MKTFFLALLTALLLSCNVHTFLIDTPNSGRAVLITIHPADKSIAYLISGAGLLYKTKNEGLKWERQNIPFRAVDIKFDPNNSENLVATGFSANGDGKGGVYVSRDGGKNWQKPSSLNRGMDGFGIAFSSNRVFVATNEGLAFSDDLTNWTLSSPFQGGDRNIIAVVDKGDGKINIAGNQGVMYSEDNGQTWQVATGDMNENVNDNDTPHNVNKFAFIPNSRIVFLTTQTDSLTRLYLSIDGGKVFRRLDTSNMRPWQRNRPSFIKLATIATGRHVLYFGNGVDLFKTRIEISFDVFPTLLGWERVEIDHPDMWDIGFWGSEPLYIVSDGGVHKSSDNGRSWKMIGGKTGLNTMEIYTVAVQRIGAGNHHDIYIGTQDNGYLVTSNNGGSWQSFCNEGAFLEVTPNEPDDNQVEVLIKCIGASPIITKAHYGNWGFWKNSPDTALDVPYLIRKDINSRRNIYFQNTKLFGKPNTFEWTPDLGENYRILFVLNYNKTILSSPKIVGISDNPVIYFGSTSNGNVNGLTRVNISGSWYLTGRPSEVVLDNNGSIESYWRMWDQRCNFAVNPNDVNHIIATDAVNRVMKVSRDGGLRWEIDNDLTNLITDNGNLQFLGAVKEIAFNRYNTDQIFIGTYQSGILYSSNNGNDWCLIDGNKNIPNIESFAFGYNNEILAATFGAGLYRIKPPRSSAPFRLLPRRQINPIIPDSVPRFYGWGNSNPMFFNFINHAIDCPTCIFLKTIDGNITDLKVSNDSLQEIVMDKGMIDAYNELGQRINFNVPIRYQKSSGKGFDTIFKGKSQSVKGIVLDNSKMIGLAFADRELKIKEKASKRDEPYVYILSVPSSLHQVDDKIELSGGNFIPNQTVDIFINGINYFSGNADNKGEFNFRIDNVRIKGLCKIRAVQKNGNSLIEAYTEVFKSPIHDKND